MNVALIGYGKMGHEIESLLLDRGHHISLIIDLDNPDDLNTDNLQQKHIDVAIEFSTPESAYGNIISCIKARVPVVCGTTGWLDKFEEVKKTCEKCNGTFFYASNYSVGVNVLFRVNEYLAKLMNRFPEYDVTIEEVHHTQKKDAPSGTAITLADAILQNVERKSQWVGQTTTTPEELEVVAVRRSVAPGTHTITYESPEDMLSLTHIAKGRRGLAMGAVLAAEFIEGRKGVYSMTDLLGF